jgi:hypothetical protein
MKSTQQEMEEFLEKDFYNALRWLFVNAVVWHASDIRPVSENRPELLPAMYASFVEARALYEFYFSQRDVNDDARVRHFFTSANSWTEQPSTLYEDYMGPRTPAQKRVFHLVYGRSKEKNAGGPGDDDRSHLKHQVLILAKDLRRITESFANSAAPEFQSLVRAALDGALDEAQKTATLYAIPNPITAA